VSRGKQVELSREKGGSKSLAQKLTNELIKPAAIPKQLKKGIGGKMDAHISPTKSDGI
jgi:hypothetical protein